MAAYRDFGRLLCLSLAVMAGFTGALEVLEDVEMEVVEDGTVDYVILDCPYTLGEEDDGLVIYWYHRENPVAVYQWIPNSPPQALGILEDRIDLSYEASEDKDHQYTALKILNPTIDISGDYSCKISTFDEEKFVYRKLVVYSKPGNVHVWADEEGEDSVKITCEVNDVYPQPEVTLHMMAEGDSDKIILEGAKEVKSFSEGHYGTKVELIMEEDSIDGPSHFECEVTLPHTDVHVTNKTHYSPRVHEVAGAVKSGSETRSAFAIVVSLAFLGLWRI